MREEKKANRIYYVSCYNNNSSANNKIIHILKKTERKREVNDVFKCIRARLIIYFPIANDNDDDDVETVANEKLIDLASKKIKSKRRR